MMKKSSINKELLNLTQEQLQERLEQYRRELFSLRLNKITAHVKNYAQFAQLRKNIARTFTVMRQKNNDAVKE